MAERCAAAITAVAHAGPGGILVHCVGGRDRTGLVTLLLLALVGVPAEEIAADYVLSAERLRGLFVAWGVEDQGPRIRQVLARRGTTAREVLLATLAGLDVTAYLRSAGVRDNADRPGPHPGCFASAMWPPVAVWLPWVRAHISRTRVRRKTS